MNGQTVILRGAKQRRLAKNLIDSAPSDAVVNIQEKRRSLDANARMWAMLSDISRTKPEGRCHTPDVWKALFMHALGFETRFLTGLNGEPFPAGFRSSRLTVRQMADLITVIAEYGDRHGVRWSEPNPYEVTNATV